MRLPFPVVLASASPRRQDLLRRLVPEFEVLPQHLDEDALTDPDPWVTAQRLAREKALAGFALRPDALVISGDTVVAYKDDEPGAQAIGSLDEGRIANPTLWRQLAKPTDEAEARRMLRVLAGRAHRVVTGLALRWPAGMEAMTETSVVVFRQLSDQEIAAYVATGEPMDKAGAYGLQGGARQFVERIEGSTTNVIGLPMEKLEEALSRLAKLSRR